MSNLNICVIGGGAWGKNHIKTLYDLGHLGGISDSNKTLISHYKKKYPDVLIYDNYKNALQNDNFEGFVVATPAETHFKIAKEIILFNKNLLVEKPLALTIDESEELVTLAKNNNVSLMVGHLLLFHPAIIKIKGLIDDGQIGKLQYIYSNRLNFGQVRTGENVFWSFAPHDISIFQYIVESYPTKIDAFGSKFLQNEISDSVIAKLKYSNGIEGHIFVSWLHPFKEHRLIVIGTEGMISFDDSKKTKPLKLYSKKFEIKNNSVKKFERSISLVDYEIKMPLKEELSYFINSLGKNKPQIANGDHALEVIKILSEVSSHLKE